MDWIGNYEDDANYIAQCKQWNEMDSYHMYLCINVVLLWLVDPILT